MWIYKPLSPHLTIYLPNNALLSSILHRISGLLNIFVLFYLCAVLKIFIWGIKFKALHNLFCSSILILLSIFYLAYLYHLLNGCRHIIWDCNKYLNIYSLKKSFLSIVVFLFTILFIITSIFIYNYE